MCPDVGLLYVQPTNLGLDGVQLESHILTYFITSLALCWPSIYCNRTNCNWLEGVVMFYPCLFCDNVSCSQRPDTPWSAHFSTVISPSWKTEQISVGNCAHQGASARRDRQTSFKIVTWTKQTWTKHHNTHETNPLTNSSQLSTVQNREDVQQKESFSFKLCFVNLKSIIFTDLPLASSSWPYLHCIYVV